MVLLQLHNRLRTMWRGGALLRLANAREDGGKTVNLVLLSVPTAHSTEIVDTQYVFGVVRSQTFKAEMEISHARKCSPPNPKCSP